MSPEDPSTRRERSEFARGLARAIENLPDNQRMAFLLKVEQGLTYEDVARVLACPVGTAKSRFHHAVLRLRAELSEWREGFAPAPSPMDGRIPSASQRRFITENPEGSA